MKKLCSLVLTLILTSSFLITAYAGVTIENPSAKSIVGVKDYVEYVEKTLKTNSFTELISDDYATRKDIVFTNNSVIFTYKTTIKTVYYIGDYDITTENVSITFKDKYISDKFGYFRKLELNESDKKVTTDLTIKDSIIEFSISNDENYELNALFTIEPNPIIENLDNKKLLSAEQTASFLAKGAWVFEDGKERFGFTNIYIIGGKVYLVDDSLADTVTTLEANYTLNKGVLIIEPLKYYKVNKFNNSINIFDYSKNKDLWLDAKSSNFTVSENLTFNILYDDVKGSIYFSSADKSLVSKITSTKKPNIPFDVTLVSSEINDNNLVNKNIVMGSENTAQVYFNFKDDGFFTGKLVNKQLEANFDGAYLFGNSQLKLKFKVSEYFMYNNNSEMLIRTTDTPEYEATIDLKFLNSSKIIANVISSSFKELVSKNITEYMEFIPVDVISEKDIPVTISDLSLSGLVNDRTFSFKNESTGVSYSLFIRNGKGMLIIDDGVMIEIVDGPISISNGEIKINNLNDFYNHGDYNEYILTENNRSTNRTSSISLFALVNKSNEVYFSVFDGFRNDSMFGSSGDARRNTLKNGPYFKFNITNSELAYPEFIDLESTDLYNFISGKSYSLNLTRKDAFKKITQKIKFESSGRVTVLTETANDGSIYYTGTYKFDDDRVVLTYTNRTFVSEDGGVSNADSTETATFKIATNNSGVYYLKALDGVYFKLVKNSSKIEVPKVS